MQTLTQADATSVRTAIRPGKNTKAPSLVALRNAVVASAHAGGEVLLKRFRTRLRVMEKPGDGIVTNADFESEKTVIRTLKEAFPDFGILTEESDPRRAKNPGRFIIDPLDGTTNFARGFPTFCVSVAAEWDGEVVAGAIHHPVSGETYTAIRGKGAFVSNGKGTRRLRVSRTDRLANAFLSTGFSSNKEKWLTQEVRTFEHMSRLAGAVRRPGSAALDLAQVARGVFDGFWERGLKPWDIAAGALMLQEAGGRITDFSGKPMRLDAGEFLASNSALHRSLIREIGSASATAVTSSSQLPTAN